MYNEKILVLDFGGQYNQLIARRVREQNVYAEILPYTASLDRIRDGNYKGIIFLLLFLQKKNNVLATAFFPFFSSVAYRFVK